MRLSKWLGSVVRGTTNSSSNGLRSTPERLLEQQWELIGILERAGARSRQLGLSACADREAARARASLEPLRRWERISESSYTTYLNDANHVRLRRLLDFVEDGDRVLDVGTGFGYVTGVLLRERRLAHYIGIDLTDQLRSAVDDMIATNGLEGEPYELEVLDVRALTAEWVARHRADVTLVLEVLEHLEDPLAALRTLTRALPVHALVLFTVPIRGRLEGVWGHVSVFDRNRIERLCADAGLTIHHVEPVYNTWTLVAASPSARRPDRLDAAGATAPRLGPAQRRVARRLPDRPAMSYSVTPVRMDGYQNFSRAGDDPSRVRLSHRLTGVFCEVEAGPSTPNEGGVRLPIAEPQLLRLQLTCHNPVAFEQIAVVGVAQNGSERLRWTWRQDRQAIAAKPATHVLQPGRSSGRFRAEGGCDPQGVVAVEVLVRARPGTTASFRVHRAAFFSAQSPADERASAS